MCIQFSSAPQIAAAAAAAARAISKLGFWFEVPGATDYRGLLDHIPRFEPLDGGRIFRRVAKARVRAIERISALRVCVRVCVQVQVRVSVAT